MTRYKIDYVRPADYTLALVRGWIEEGTLGLEMNGQIVAGASILDLRPDVAELHGPGADRWGFVAIFRCPEPIAIGQNARFFINGPQGREDIDNAHYNQAVADMLGQPRAETIFREAMVGAGRGRMLEIGSRARSGEVYRHLFPQGMDYVGIDIMAGPNVDIVADAHDLPADMTESFDFAFSVSVFEHLLMPWKAALELNRVLKPGGVAYIQSHGGFPLHEEPWDFFRFSKNSWKALFNHYTGFEVLEAEEWQPATLMPNLALGGPLAGVSSGRNFMLSACTVRKVAPATVTWDAKPQSLLDGTYNHA